MDTIFIIFSFLFLCISYSTYTMDGIPKKEPKRDKKSIIPHLWHTKETTFPSNNQELSIPEKKTKRMINSAPPSLDAKTVDQKKSTVLPTVIATNPELEHSQLTLTEILNVDERIPRNQDKRSKHTISRSLSPAKKEPVHSHNENLSSSDPGKNFFKRHPRDKSTINHSKKTISTSPRKSPKKSQAPVDFESALNAIRHQEANLIKDFFNNSENNPNKPDDNGNTLAHHATLIAVAKNNSSLLIEFILNPHVNFLFKNKYGNAPYQLIINTDVAKHQNIVKLLIERTILARIAHAMIISDKELVTEKCSDNVIVPKIKALLNRISQDVLPSYADGAFILAMIQHILKHDLPIIKIVHDFYVSNPNHQDEWGDTMLHHATYLRDASKIKKLVENPNVISKRNNEGLFPQGLLHSLEKNVSIQRSMLFVRGSIDSWIEQEVDGLLFANPLIDTLHKKDACFKNVKRLMKKNFTAVENAQKGSDSEDNDRVLPKESAQLPAYITDDFLLNLFQTHMKIKKGNNRITLDGFNPNPTFTESSDSEKHKNEFRACTSSSLEKQLSAIEEKIMEEIESGNIKPVKSDSNLMGANNSSPSISKKKKSTG